MTVSQCGKCPELWTFLQVQSQIPSSVMMKLALMRTDTGKEEPELPLLQRISLLVNCTSYCSRNKCNKSNRHISTSTVQRKLCKSGLHGRIAAKKPLLKDTNKKKRVACAKKHEQWTLDWWKSFFLLVWWVQIWDFLFQPSCLCETQIRWTDDLCMRGSYYEAWRRRCDGVGGALQLTLSWFT